MSKIFAASLALLLFTQCADNQQNLPPEVQHGESLPADPTPADPAAPEDEERLRQEAAVRKAASEKRLGELRDKIKKLTADAFWETAESANKQQHWKEAREAYRGLTIHHPTDKRATVAAQRSTLAAFRLGEYGDGLTFLEDSLELFRGTIDEARVLRVLANLQLAVPHWGVKKGGELIRARWDQGIYQDTHRLDRSLAIRRLEQAREIFLAAQKEAGKLDAAQVEERIACEMDLVAALARFTPLDGTWPYWYYAWSEAAEDDLVDEEGADERAGRWYAQNLLYRAEPRGMPVDGEGKVIFSARPEKYSAGLDDTAKIKFLLQEISTLDNTPSKKFAAEALYRQALLFRARDGAERLQRLAGWWWNGTHPYKADIEAKKPWELQEDEVLGLIATHIGVYRVPEDENTLRLLRRIISEYPSSGLVERAQVSIGAFYQSRQQYDLAIKSYDEYLRKYPNGALRGEAQSYLNQIRQPEVKIEDGGAQSAGAPARLTLQHRNVQLLSGRARPLDSAKFVASFKERWKSPDNYYYYPESPNQLFINADEKVIEKFATAPWKTFELQVEDDRTHRPMKSEVRIPIMDQGLWLVEIHDREQPARRYSRGLVMLETTAVVGKSTSDGDLIWVVDSRTGVPLDGAEVEIFEYWHDWEANAQKSIPRSTITETKTDADGLARHKRKRNGAQTLISVRHGNRFAWSGEGYYWQYYPSGEQEGYIGLVFTDRPVYRPQQTIKFQAWVRRKVGGAYENASRIQNIRVAVYDPKNERIFEKTEQARGTGGAAFELTLKKDAALGMYRIDVQGDAGWVAADGNQFRVEEYKAPEFEVAVTVGEGPAKLGVKIPAKITAEYYFGGAVEGAKVKYKVFRAEADVAWLAPGPWDWLYGPGYGRCYYAYPWFGWWREWGWRPWVWYPWWGPKPEAKKELVQEGEGILGHDGTLALEIDTAQAKASYGDRDQRFIVEADVTDASRRTISGQGEVLATRNQFAIHLDTDRGYYETGSTARIDVTSLLPSGQPIATTGEIRIAEVAFRGDNGDTVEEAPLEKRGAQTDAEGKMSFTFDAKKAGQYRLSYVAKDAWGGEVVGTSLIWVWGAGFDGRQFKFNHLQIITDKRTYAVGETAKLLISSDVAGARVLFSEKVDNGHLLSPVVLALQGKTRVVTLPITPAHVPNFFVEATLVAGGKISQEARELFVPPPKAELKVSLTPKASEFRAGKDGELEVLTTGTNGEPISTDVAISVYDKAVLYIQPELTPDARKHFWGRTRVHQVLSLTNLRRRYDNWQYMSQPELGAANMFAIATNAWMQQSLDFAGGDTATLERSVLGATSVNEASGIGGLGMRGNGAGGGGAGEPAARAAAPAPAAAEASKDARVRGDLAKADALEGRMGKKERAAGAEDAERDQQQAGAAIVAPTVRKNFADTATFKVVRTDAAGRATVKWTFPDNLTTWRAKAIAVSEDTRAGEATASLITTQKLLVRLQAPRFFRERDRLVISANVHNRLPQEKKVTVELAVTDSLLKVQGEKTRHVTVPKDGERRVDFWVEVQGEGEAKVRVSALTDVESDAKEMSFPVLVHGFMKTDSAVGSIAASAGDPAERSVELDVPAERRLDRGELVVRWSPTLAGAMIDALPYLLEYPYGCTEQTMSRFFPAVITRKTLQLAGGYSLEDLEKIRTSMNPQHLDGADPQRKARLERDYHRWNRSPVYNTALMDDMIATGMNRITKMQRPDGGWGWWGGDRSSIYTTAYVLFGLFEARSADIGVPQHLLDRGLNAMTAMMPEHLQYYEQHDYVSDTDAFFAYVLSLFGRSDEKLNGYLFARRARLSVYGKSLLTLALWNIGKKDDARIVLRNAEQFLKEDAENETAWIETNQNYWWYWWNDGIESNAFFLRALITVKPDDPRAPRIVKWLLNHRKHGWYWSSTRDTAITIAAFAQYMRAAKETATDYELEVAIDGKVMKTVHIDAKNLLTFDGELRLPTSELASGKHRLSFRRKGRGAVYFNSYLSYFTLEEDAPPSGLEIKVDRRYYKLVREDRTHQAFDQRGRQTAMKEAAYRRVPLKSGDDVVSGDLILVELMVESKNNYTFLAFEDPKPAGAEPVALRSGVTFGEAVANLELRDDRVVFFLTELNQGKLKLEYRLRAEIPGSFHAMPARGFGMYSPELQATSAEMRLGIDEGPGDR